MSRGQFNVEQQFVFRGNQANGPCPGEGLRARVFGVDELQEEHVPISEQYMTPPLKTFMDSSLSFFLSFFLSLFPLSSSSSVSLPLGNEFGWTVGRELLSPWSFFTVRSLRSICKWEKERGNDLCAASEFVYFSRKSERRADAAPTNGENFRVTEAISCERKIWENESKSISNEKVMIE